MDGQIQVDLDTSLAKNAAPVANLDANGFPDGDWLTIRLGSHGFGQWSPNFGRDAR